jgi:hypothetical protein
METSCTNKRDLDSFCKRIVSMNSETILRRSRRLAGLPPVEVDALFSENNHSGTCLTILLMTCAVVFALWN